MNPGGRAKGTTDRTEIDRLVFRAVNAGRWADFERLFQSRGGPKACWCLNVK